jgi:hypothetical protein
MSNLVYQRTGDLQKAIQQLIGNLNSTGSGKGADAIATNDGTVQSDITALQTSVTALQIDNASSATVAASAGINTVETYISVPISIAANTSLAGDSFVFEILGNCTSSAANASTFTIRFGSNGTTADSSLGAFGTFAATTGTNIPFSVRIILTIRTIGAGGTCIFSGFGVNNSTSNGISASATFTGVGAPSAVDTTGNAFLGVSYKTGAATTTTTFQQVIITKIS